MTGRGFEPMRSLFWSGVACLVLVGCSPQNQVVVINQSNLQLRDVLVSGSGFSEQLGTIAPHEERRVVVHCRGESGLKISFKTDGNDVSFGPGGYFEGSGGYQVTATVSKDLGVSVKSELARY
jgi:hypothetical protein